MTCDKPAAAAKLLQSCPTLCDPIDGSPPDSPVTGILQARILEWVAISFSSAWKWKVKVKSLSPVQLLATPMDCSPPGSSAHGIFQARVLEWGAIAFSCDRVRSVLMLDKAEIPVLTEQRWKIRLSRTWLKRLRSSNWWYNLFPAATSSPPNSKFLK